MMAKRIIPCLDIKNGRTVKGTNFENLRDAGDPVELATRYSLEGADELVFLDITATEERRKTVIDLVKKVGETINIPFAVGGGVNDVNTVYDILQHGADKVCVNSAAIKRPELVKDIADRFGSQCLVVAVDAKQMNGDWKVYTHGGKQATDIDLYDWANRMTDMGCGEILFTSMDHDGTKAGFALEALAKLSELVSVPVIASGGAGSEDHFIDVFAQTEVTGALAASIFHYQEVAILELKNRLIENNIPIRR